MNIISLICIVILATLLAGVASPEFHPLVKKSKDVAAGAVLISAIGSVIIGFLVLGPHLIDWTR